MKAKKIIKGIAQICWQIHHPEEQCPESEIPSELQLVKYLESKTCPQITLDMCRNRLGTVHEMTTNDSDVELEWETKDNQLGVRIPSGRWIGIPTVHATWKRVQDKDAEILHPLTPLIQAWHKRPIWISANKRIDRGRIIPAKIARLNIENGNRGRLFSAPRSISKQDTDAQLPVLENAGYTTPALPLALYDLGVNLDSPGPGAPLPLRLFVEAILAVGLSDRGMGPVALQEVSVRWLLNRLYPHRTPRKTEWMPKIDAAQAALASRNAAIRWDDGILRSAVLITSFPEHLDDPVRIVVDIPENAIHGPQVSPRLHLYGPQKGKHYRALLNLAYWWYEPGKTVFKGRDNRWHLSTNPEMYRKPDNQELVSLVSPRTSRRETRKLVQESLRVFTDLANDGEIRLIDGKPIPPIPKKMTDENLE